MLLLIVDISSPLHRNQPFLVVRFSKAIQTSPGTASIYRDRSEAWQKVGNSTLALADAGVAVCLRPRVSAGYTRLGEVFLALGRCGDATRAFKLVRGLNIACCRPLGRLSVYSRNRKIH